MHKLLSLFFILTITIILAGCISVNVKEEVYSELEIGEIFGINRDGHHQKLPQNYCLGVDLGSTTKLFKIPDEMLDVGFYSESVYNTPGILEGRYVRGYFDDEKIVLCEEVSYREFEYVIFYFSTQETFLITESFAEQVRTSDWFSLCNIIGGGLYEDLKI